MNDNIATWFELPVSDMPRAKTFYQKVLQAEFKDEEMSGMQMAIFSAEPGAVSGMLVLGETYQPSQTGAVVYFNGGEDLAAPLERALQHGGSVVVPKTPIHDGECGYFALILDSEGNRVGLYSQA
ncbi:VOC family protein [Methylomonas methanica]|uniref:Glyoxalase/bleomycin resistance protein/dioxygenase n=1 Tax=Methylomonas methanica (strain DSM 25384 / MC09) TaxID=857087 RepID=G0A665_METMM|nr:VOC family protein [Methylomonas methanica]AEG00515.1 Glyoxalase/bleomycin resistance protein/dioxygenase [Methylomonas methanica MC09]